MIAEPIEKCSLHELDNCADYFPPVQSHTRAQPSNSPSGSYLSVRGGKGVYRHPDCYNVTGEWDGAASAVLGERVVLTVDDLKTSDLRPAGCCSPPLIRRV